MRYLALALAFALAPLAPASAWADPPQPAAHGATVPGVTVTAQRPTTQTLVDRKVYTVTGNLQSITGSAADILNEVPSVNVDPDGNVSLRGDPNITILIDGKPAAQFTGAAKGLSLLQFPASEIDRVEVLTSPPAQYKAEGSGGVINIVTRKRRTAGLSGTARASVGDHGRFLVGVDGAYNAGPLRVSGGGGIRLDTRERVTTTDRLETAPATTSAVASQERIDERFRRLTPWLNGGVDYEATARETVGGSFNWRQLTGHRVFDQNDAAGAPDAAPSSLSLRHSDGHELHLEAGGEVHLVQKLRRPQETFSLALQRSLVRERERYDYTDTFQLPVAPAALSDLHLGLDLVKTEASADYDLPLPSGPDIKLGYDFEADDNRFDNSGDFIDPATGQATVDPAVTNDFRYHQQVHALYGSVDHVEGPWRLQAGVRVEAARAAWLLVTGHVPGARSDFGVYPSLHLDRSLGDSGKLNFGLSRRITRPDPEALNPFSDHQDTRNLRAGNPNLKPQDTWLFELGYAFAKGPTSYGATAYYRIDRDSVTDIVKPLGADIVLTTKTNLPESRSAGVDFNVGGKLGSRLSYSLAGNAFYAQINAAMLGAHGLQSTIGVDLKASIEFRPTKADMLQISFSRQDKRLTPQGDVGAINLVNLGYRRDLRPDLALVATGSDVLDGQRFRRVVSAPGLRDDYIRHQIGRVVSIGLIYSFGGPSKGKSSGFEYEQ